MVPGPPAGHPRRARSAAAARGRARARRRLRLGAHAGGARGLRRGERHRAQRRRGRAGPRARPRRGRVGRLEELPVGRRHVRPDHLPGRDRALARRRRRAGELRRVCRPGGWLLVTVPAYQALWSRHDEANHHYRRYSRAVAARGGAVGRVGGRADELVQQPAAGPGRRGAPGAAALPDAQRRQQRSRPRPRVAQRCARASAGARGELAGARAHAAGGLVAAGGAAAAARRR